jgi:peptidoglycan/xylan/chitin deacetylase (PgdA/CDA1 family)
MIKDKFLALKVDVDTLKGYLEGVPKLLEIFDDRNIKVTFLFSFGPDNSGKAIRRIFRKGFLQKMFRTKAPSTYGLKTLLYGTLLPAPMIVDPNPKQFVSAVESGHDCGIHAWDHVKWQDNIKELSEDEITEDFSKAAEIFKKYSGFMPRCCGAPGWQVSEASLTVQDKFNVDFCSDTRGTHGDLPFMPHLNGKTFCTLQIPSTLPTLDEVLGVNNVNVNNFDEFYLDILQEGLNVHTIHTEMEGGDLAGVFERFMDACLKRGVVFKTLSEVAGEVHREHTPSCEIEDGIVPGRAGRVAIPRILTELIC